MGKLRIHIPLVTHEECYYLISKDRKDCLFHAWHGGCFALDTGYIHGVHNKSDIERVHMMIELNVNDSILDMLPKKNIDWYLHLLNFSMILVPVFFIKRFYKEVYNFLGSFLKD